MSSSFTGSPHSATTHSVTIWSYNTPEWGVLQLWQQLCSRVIMIQMLWQPIHNCNVHSIPQSHDRHLQPLLLISDKRSQWSSPWVVISHSPKSYIMLCDSLNDHNWNCWTCHHKLEWWHDGFDLQVCHLQLQLTADTYSESSDISGHVGTWYWIYIFICWWYHGYFILDNNLLSLAKLFEIL